MFTPTSSSMIGLYLHKLPLKSYIPLLDPSTKIQVNYVGSNTMRNIPYILWGKLLLPVLSFDKMREILGGSTPNLLMISIGTYFVQCIRNGPRRNFIGFTSTPLEHCPVTQYLKKQNWHNHICSCFCRLPLETNAMTIFFNAQNDYNSFNVFRLSSTMPKKN